MVDDCKYKFKSRQSNAPKYQFKESEPANSPELWDMVQRCLFLCWDGVVFWGLNVGKLRRVRGEKPGWCDKCRSIESVII